MTSEELYARLISKAFSAYAGQASDMKRVEQMAHYLTKACVEECIALGWITATVPRAAPLDPRTAALYPRAAPIDPLDAAKPPTSPAPVPVLNPFDPRGTAPYAGYVTAQDRPPVGSPGIPVFAEMIPSQAPGHVSAGPGAVLPVGSPFQAVQHYNAPNTSAPQPAQPHALATETAAQWHAPPIQRPGSTANAPGTAAGLEPSRPWFPPHLAYLHRSVPLPSGASSPGPHDVAGSAEISTPAAPRVMGNQTFVPPEGTGANKR